MKKLNKIIIDYSLFEKYGEDYLSMNLIIPIYEDDMYIKVAICKESKLLDIESKFNKLVSYSEYTKEEIQFFLLNLELRKKLTKLSLKVIYSNLNDNFLELFFNELISFCIKIRSSDLHFESNEEFTIVRLRIDGRMKKFFIFKKELFRFLSSYIKLISNLDITQTRIPMDSRFSLNVSEKKYDFRVSTMPTVSGESIVLRILDKTNIEKNLNNLGFNESLLNEFKNIINLAQGLVLVAGPTGSGKTTTLYSLLKELNSEDKKIITVEDPVEYKIEDITQISINSKIGLNFELVLKNILRQDPDVIFIGEIRDKFSLDIALQASLTGHLVIATIHSNSALQTITRLIDLNADTFLLSTTLKYILSQRLVINYCKKCQGNGCSHCNFTKFYDRSCIAELLKVDEKISSMIFTKSSLIQIEKYLKTINYKTILEDGIEKVNNGVTSIEEIYKVL